MSLLLERNPIYKVKSTPSQVQGELMNKTLNGIDIIVNNERYSIKSKCKYVVKHTCRYPEDITIDLYSARKITITDGTIYIDFAYQEDWPITLTEDDIIEIVPVRKKARIEDDDIQALISTLNAADQQ